LRRLAGPTVYALDLPGHGKSGGQSRASIPGYAAVILNFAQALGLPPFVAGGHSMGGAIVQEFAFRYPDRVAGIVLVGTGAKLRVAPEILQGIHSDFRSTVELITQWSWGPSASPAIVSTAARRQQKVPPEVLHDDYEACDTFDRRNEAAQIQAPALIICGTDDRMTPPRFSQWLAERLPGNVRLILVPGAGHIVMLEQPQTVTEAVSGFLSDLNAAA
jgi:pimeloyl-ACP methyl ester carboxylesterase